MLQCRCSRHTVLLLVTGRVAPSVLVLQSVVLFDHCFLCYACFYVHVVLAVSIVLLSPLSYHTMALAGYGFRTLIPVAA